MTYFGPPPWWLPAFFVSCRANADVRWLVYTDFPPLPHVPPNVTLVPMTAADLDRRARDVLGADVGVAQKLRKACDLKPMYGVLFEHDLAPYDFWAYSDLDIVWGEVRRFVSGEMLDRYDVISSRPGALSGHFTLLRNTAATNRLFELIPNVRAELEGSKHAHIDETQLSRHLRRRLGPVPWLWRPRSAPRVYWRQEWTINSEYQRALGPDERLTWRAGRTFDAQGKELMYLHFHKLKAHMSAISFGYGDAPASFTLGRRGILA